MVASPAAEIFRQAAALIANDPRRKGNVVHLGGCDVLAVGDLHGNRPNLTKILQYASRSATRQRVTVLQEIIHGPADERAGVDRSAELLLRAARQKVTNPDSIVMLLSNHDVAQLTGNEVMKNGQAYCRGFQAGVSYSFGEDAADVMAAINELLLSLPLAARTDNGVFIAHSLPSPSRMAGAGLAILDRPYVSEDFRRGGAVYEWTWGRDHTCEQIVELAAALDVKLFILGHRHIDCGCDAFSPCAMTIMTQDARGSICEFPADQPLDMDSMLKCVRPVASL